MIICLKIEVPYMIYKLDNPRVWRTYTGGDNLDVIHGMMPGALGSNYPEEWIVSDTASTGKKEGEGLSLIPSLGNLPLKSLISDSPSLFLGSSHVRKYGPRLGVLTKLIDSAERLTIQVHPDKLKAMEYFSSPFGKTECWYILGGSDPCVYAGFREGVTRELWKDLFDKQDTQGLLDCLIRHSVKEGDTVLIPGGLPHAIGADTFLIEIQEPTDYTLRFEKITPQGLQISDEQCHLGLGFDRIFDCCDYTTFTPDEARMQLFLRSYPRLDEDGVSLYKIVDYMDTPCFAMDKAMIREGKTLKLPDEGSFYGVYCYRGDGVMVSGDEAMDIRQGDQFFIPASEKEVSIGSRKGLMEVFLIRGPIVG